MVFSGVDWASHCKLYFKKEKQVFFKVYFMLDLYCCAFLHSNNFQYLLNKNAAFTWIHLTWQHNPPHYNNQAGAWFQHLSGNWFPNGKIHQNCVNIFSVQSHLTMQDSTPTLHFAEFLCKLFLRILSILFLFFIYLVGFLFCFILLAISLLVHFKILAI